MHDLSELRAAWNHTHQEKPGLEQPERELVAQIQGLQRQPQPGERVLDAGCGKGRNTLYLSQTGFAVYGCDLAPTATQMAKTRVRQEKETVRFQVAHLAHLPYADGAFGGIACVRVLPYHYKADIANIAREFWRVLQPDGWLYADFLDCDDAEYGCGRELEENTFLDPEGMPVHFSSRQEIDELLDGFSPERVERLELGSSSRPRIAWAVWATKHEGDQHARETN
jgi:SAM-dependent methyltransferase